MELDNGELDWAAVADPYVLTRQTSGTTSLYKADNASVSKITDLQANVSELRQIHVLLTVHR